MFIFPMKIDDQCMEGIKGNGFEMDDIKDGG
jgi:hypothetical protein